MLQQTKLASFCSMNYKSTPCQLSLQGYSTKILQLRMKGNWVVSFRLRPTYPQLKWSWHPADRTMGRSQSSSELNPCCCHCHSHSVQSKTNRGTYQKYMSKKTMSIKQWSGYELWRFITLRTDQGKKVLCGLSFWPEMCKIRAYKSTGHSPHQQPLR